MKTRITHVTLIRRHDLLPDAAIDIENGKILAVHETPPAPDSAFACFDGLRIPLPPDCTFPAGPALLGVRPEDLILQEGGGPDSLTARVELVEMTGGDNYIHLAAGQSRLTLKCSSRLHFAVDQEISFSIPADRVLLFPPEQS